MKGRDQRMRRIGAREIGGGQLLEVRPRNQRIHVGLVRKACPGHLQVDPRRYQPGAARQQLSGITQSYHKRQPEAPTPPVAPDPYLARGNPPTQPETPARPSTSPCAPQS